MSHLPSPIAAIIASYKTKSSKMRHPWDRWQFHVIDLAARLHFAHRDEDAPFDESSDSYCYLYLDTRKPKGRYAFSCPSGFTYATSYPVYYVGQGKGKRSQAHLKAALRKEAGYKSFSSNLPKINTTRAILRETGDIPKIVVMKGRLSRSLACAFEIDLIAGIGRRDLNEGPLTNMTDGGEGVSGYRFTEVDRKIMSEAQRLRFASETSEQKAARVNKAKRTKAKRPEVEKQRVQKIKEFNRRESVRAAKSAQARKQWSSGEFRENKIKKQVRTWELKSAEEKEQHARRSGASSRRMWADRSDAERARFGAMSSERERAKAPQFVWHFTDGRVVHVRNKPIGVFSREHGLNQNKVSLVLRGLQETYKGMRGYYAGNGGNR